MQLIEEPHLLLLLSKSVVLVVSLLFFKLDNESPLPVSSFLSTFLSLFPVDFSESDDDESVEET